MEKTGRKLEKNEIIYEIVTFDKINFVFYFIVIYRGLTVNT